MSPEQAQDAAHVTEGTDVYGLGATLYALLTGRPPFRGSTVAEILHQVKYREPAAPRRLNPKVSRDLETIVLKCLEKEPERRFATAAEVADELRRYLEGRPIRTRPVGPVGRLGRWSRRNPALATVSAAALILIALAGGFYWKYQSTAASAATASDQADKRDAAAKLESDETKYLEDMPVVQKHLDARERARAREMLAQWEPVANQPDHRGWEWYFLDALCNEVQFSVRGHRGPVQAAGWAPDGDRLASADGQGNVKVWSVPEAKEIIAVRAPAGVNALAWSPDGKLLAAATQGVLQVWEAVTGKEVRTWRLAADNHTPLALPPGPGEVSLPRFVFIGSWTMSLAWSPNGQRLALADADGKVQIWDAGTDKNGLVLKAHGGGVHSIDWSPDSSQLASVGGDGHLKVWDAATGEEAFKLPVRQGNDVMWLASYALTIAWTEDGKRLNLAFGEGEIRVLDAASGTVVSTRKLIPRDRMVQQGLTGAPPRRFVWSPGGKLLASIQTGGEIKLWDTVTGKEGISMGTPGDPVHVVGSPAWDRSGQRLVLCGMDGTVMASSVGSRQRVRGLTIPNALAWSSDSRHVLSAPGAENDFKPVLEQFQARMKAFEKAADSFRGLTPPDPNMLNRGGGTVPSVQHPIQVRDAITGEVVRTVGNPAQWDVLAQSPDGKWLAAATNAGLLQLWLMAEGGQAVTLEQPPAVGARVRIPPANRVVLSWSPDSTRLACSTHIQMTIRLWDPTTRKTAGTLQGYDKPLRALAWSADGRRLASAGDDGSVRVWDALGGDTTSTLSFFVKHDSSGKANPRAFSMLSWSPDGKRLAVAGEDGAIKVWDVDTGQAVVTLYAHPPNDIQEVICAVAWNPDGKRLASSSPDGTFLLWDTASWQEVLSLAGPSLPFQPRFGMTPTGGGTLAWSPDGRQLGFFAGGDRLIIWDGTPGN